MFKMRGCKTVPPISLCLILTVVLGLTSCGPPNRYPQFNEQAIAGSGTYDIPQWSPDSKYLGYLDTSDGLEKVNVYDSETGETWTVASSGYIAHFAWTPDGRISYAKYRPELSNTPRRSISEIHIVDFHGRTDELVTEALHAVGDFGWLSGGQELAILLPDPDAENWCRNLYLIDVSIGTRRLLATAEDAGVDCIETVAISDDDSLIALSGRPEGAAEKLTIYSLNEERVTRQISPREAIPRGDLQAPEPSLSMTPNFGLLPGNEWLVGNIGAPSGPCYRGGLFFLNILELADSFCIPTADEGIISAPVVSPDLSMISYITVLGPGSEYLMLGEVPAEIRDRLQISDE